MKRIAKGPFSGIFIKLHAEEKERGGDFVAVPSPSMELYYGNVFCHLNTEKYKRDLNFQILRHAARINYKDLRKLLFKNKNLKHRKETLNTALLYCFEHNLETLRRTEEERRACVHVLISEGADVNYKTGAVLLAALKKSEHLSIREIVEAGCDIHNTTCDYLRFAVINGQTEATNILLKHGADPNRLSDEGDLPLTVSIKYLNEMPIMQSLYIAGANINGLDSKGNTPLLVALEDYHMDCRRAFIINRDNILLFLFRRGADCNIQNKEGVTPLMHAVQNKNELVVLSLLVNGANINLKNCHGRTCIFALADKKLKEDFLLMVGLLRIHGADFNVVDHAGFGLLYYILAEGERTLSQGLGKYAWELVYFNVNLRGVQSLIHQFELRSGICFFCSGYGLCAVLKGFQDVLLDLGFYSSNCNSVKEHCNFITLKQICRNTVREHMGKQLREGIENIILPKSVKDFILLETWAGMFT